MSHLHQHRIFLLILFIGLWRLTLPANAATPIHETHPLDPHGKVEIVSLTGQVEVRVWDRPEVEIHGTLSEDVERVDIKAETRELEIKVHHRRSRRGLFNSGNTASAEITHLSITVPHQASVEIETISADITVDGSAGSELEIETVSGSVTVAGRPREVDIETVSGNVQLTVDDSREIEIETVSGAVNVRGRLSGKLKVETVSGHIQVLTSPDLSARIRAKSFSGRLRMPGTSTPATHINSSIEHRYGAGHGDIRLESFSGNIDLVLAEP